MPERSQILSKGSQSARPRAWLTVLRLAFGVAPLRTMAGLWWLATLRRVRGWNVLCDAASRHPGAHRAWVAKVETHLFSATRSTTGSVSITVVTMVTPDQPATLRLATEAIGSVWVVPLSPADQLSPELGAILARVDAPGIDLVFWDEDVATPRGRERPWFKPDWDPLPSVDGFGLPGACALRMSALATVPGLSWRDRIKALAERSAPHHVPLILTHRGAPPAHVPRPVPTIRAPATISVVIPTRDHAEMLADCLDSLDATTFPAARQLIIIDNGTTEPAALRLIDRIAARPDARVLSCPGPFNFAALVNRGVAEAQLDLVCLLNNDVVALGSDWPGAMADHAVRADVGAVGAKLMYPDGTIQHAGVAVGIGDAAGHVERGVRPDPHGFAPWHAMTRTVSAVTAACLLVARAKYDAVGGMDAETFAVDFNDVDLCLRLAARGWRTVYCAEAVLEHRESISRGRRRGGADAARFARELAALRARWHTTGMIDPHSSPRMRRWSELCVAAF